MKTKVFAAAMLLAAGSIASATPVLQMDLNSFAAQATNSGGTNSAFGGLSHTGSVKFSLGSGGVLNGIFIQSVANGVFSNAGFSGFTMTNFSGQVNLNNGMVTGGSLTVTLNNGDNYTCNIAAGSGAVSNYVGGGFKIEALTSGGMFNDSVYGNVNVSPWFNSQTVPGGLPGSFLQFNFNPTSTGFATSDMDLFVDVAQLVPLPPAALAGLTMLGCLTVVRRIRR